MKGARPSAAHGANPTLAEVWAGTVRRRGEDRAVVEAATGRSCTFRELDEQATAWLATHTAGLPRLRGHAVAFAAPNGIEWLAMFVGLLRAGAVILPFDATEPAAAQRRTAELLRARAWWDGARLVPLDGAKPFRTPGICLVKLTSGTTGQPRPLAFTGAQMLADGRQVARTMGIRAADLNYALIPLGHSYGLGNLTLPLIAGGIPVVCGSAPLPQVIAAEISRWRPTVFPSVPAVFRALAASDVAVAPLASLRLAISAGAPLPAELARGYAARFGRRIHNFYGSSETGGIAYDRTGAATLAGGVGRAMRGVQVKRWPGGRIEVCSPSVFTRGNARRCRDLGCWIPPDCARLDARGQITLLGRRDRTVKLAGRRLNLGEVAARLRRLAGVADVWVGVRRGAEPVLGAAIVSGRSAGELRTELLADTAGWKVPRRLVMLRQLPITARGKTDTRALQEAVFG